MAKKKRKKHASKIGMPPGTILHTGEKKVEKVSLEVIEYSPTNIERRRLKNISDADPIRDSKPVSWLNITGLHDTEVMRHIGDHFSIHPLVLEDILHIGQRPKIEIYDDYIFAVVNMLRYDGKEKEIQSEQVSLILGKNYVFTFQEREGDIWDPLRERLKIPTGRARKNGPDYLFYALIDIIVDNYYIVLDAIGDRIEEVEDQITENPQMPPSAELHRYKNQLATFRKISWPVRDILNTMMREETDLIQPTTTPFLRDVYDHIMYVVDSVDGYREMVSGLMDLYLSLVSNRMNEVMKVLTIIATIFIPLSFIAGVYGMNFEYMPELKWKWGYFILWGIILCISGGMLYFFRRKKWL